MPNKTVPYPDPTKPMHGMGNGYANRNLFWSLEYRGALRKKILDYAFERDLMHPEDFGTMTHWYSATPQEFLDQIKPEFTPQVSGYSLPTEQVWDIRFDHNLDNYWKLTQASIDHYGKPEIFLTIGFAERMVYTGQKETFVAGRDEIIRHRGALLAETQATPLAEMAPTDPQTHEHFTEVVTRHYEAAKIVVR